MTARSLNEKSQHRDPLSAPAAPAEVPPVAPASVFPDPAGLEPGRAADASSVPFRAVPSAGQPVLPAPPEREPASPVTFRPGGPAAAGAPSSLHYVNGRAVICCPGAIGDHAAADLAALTSWLARNTNLIPDGTEPGVSVTVQPVSHDDFVKYGLLHPAHCDVSPGRVMLAVCANIIKDDARATELGQILTSYLSRLQASAWQRPA